MLGCTQMHHGHINGEVTKIQPENIMLNMRTLATLLFLALMLPLAALAGGLPPCPVENAVMCNENVALVPEQSALGPSFWVHTKKRVTEEQLNRIKKIDGVTTAIAHHDYKVFVARAPMVPEKELIEKLYKLFQ